MRPISTPERRVVIDARPRSARGLFAGEMVLGKSLLSHTIENSLSVGSGGSPIVVLVDEVDRFEVDRLLGGHRSGRFELADSLAPSDALILRTDRLYEPRRLRKAAARGGDPETAVLWRLDGPLSVEVAGDELLRRRAYQPLGRYWAFPIARMIADRLVATPVRPNALTLIAGLLMIAAAALIAAAPSTIATRTIAATAMAIALVLDTADGRLARIQGTSSPFGRWLDNVLDELADVSLHAAIAWAAFVGSGRPGWLALGILYASGKYLFVIQSTAGEILDRAQGRSAGAPIDPNLDGPTVDRRGFLGALRTVARGLGHADFRWHVWIVLAAVGRLDVALAVYAVYFPARAGMSCLKRGVEHVIC
jgi:hypothetical protein